MGARLLNDMDSKSRPTAVVFCDFDGTITQVDVTDVILAELAHPSWREIEQEWVRGTIGSRQCLERQMALVETSERELNALIDSVPLDPHFARFYRFLGKRGVPCYVVSDGFDYVIRRVMKRAGIDGRLRNGDHFFASTLRIEGRSLVASFPHAVAACGHGCATCKAVIMRRLGRGRHPIIFIGDGLSDRFAVEESDVVFAKRQLLTYCREKGIACHPFETFADVELEFDRLAGKVRGESKGRKSRAGGQKVLLSTP
jgi:2,3-diketo-5-methylthio-1-phosphopentane phosphatase